MKAEDDNLDERKLVPPEGRASARPGSSPYRRHPIHLPPLERHNLPIIIFVTACTAARRKILASPRTHEVIVQSWRSADRWIVGRYVIMPDHVHFFCSPNDLHPSSLEKWMRYWKSIATRNLGEPASRLWQRHFWDRQLRREESYSEKWQYICGNPVRHGLVETPEKWPYQGELNELRW